MSNKKTTSELIEDLRKSVAALEKRHFLKPEEVEAFNHMYKLYVGWHSLGVLYGALQKIFLAFAFITGAIIAFRSGLLNFLGLGGPPAP